LSEDFVPKKFVEELKEICEKTFGKQIRLQPVEYGSYEWQYLDEDTKLWVPFNIRLLVQYNVDEDSNKHSPFLAPPAGSPKQRSSYAEFSEVPRNPLEAMALDLKRREEDKVMASQGLMELFGHFESWIAQKERKRKARAKIEAEATDEALKAEGL
jgi:hypothetical protein